MSTQGRSGWRVEHPRYMRAVPKDRSDLFREVHGAPWDELICDSEAEAERKSTRLLVDLKQHAEWQLKANSTPAAEGKERNQQAALAEGQRWLEIADAGLKILGVTPERYEALSNIQQVRA